MTNHSSPVEKPRVDPGRTGGVASLSWLRNICKRPREELEEVAGEKDVWIDCVNYHKYHSDMQLENEWKKGLTSDKAVCNHFKCMHKMVIELQE